ncbi:GntR family transcriptional regulator [Nocardia sp. NPDC047038]|uniref:GntR family transcriptional regulator n=1 Tax=Nocardia sp. NPDC047038 TaxID=3154338 RepID=UPI0033F003EE
MVSSEAPGASSHPVAAQVATTLHKMILDGRLRAGERIKESLLARDLEVSRNTVRSALISLESAGFARHTPNKGWVVWQPTEKEIMDLYLARYHLETAAARSVSPSTDFSTLKSALDDLLTAYSTSDTQTIVEKDLAFHGAIVGLLGSAHLDRYYQKLLEALGYCFTVAYNTAVPRDAASLKQEHLEIYQAITSGNVDRAEKIIAKTVMTGREDVRRSLAGESPLLLEEA